MSSRRRSARDAGLLPLAATVVGLTAIAGVLALVRVVAPQPSAPSTNASYAAPAHPSPPPRPKLAPGSGATALVPAVPAQRSGALEAEPPRAVRLPDATVVPVRGVSTSADGVLDVPDDIRTAGWWRGGSQVGDPFGATLVAAHVDSRLQGLGPYAALLDVRPGDRFVLFSKGLRQVFETTSLRLVEQGPLRDERWMYSPSGDRRLVLVTCAPPFLPERGGYQRLAVATAEPLGEAVPRGN